MSPKHKGRIYLHLINWHFMSVWCVTLLLPSCAAVSCYWLDVNISSVCRHTNVLIKLKNTHLYVNSLHCRDMLWQWGRSICLLPPHFVTICHFSALTFIGSLLLSNRVCLNSTVQIKLQFWPFFFFFCLIPSRGFVVAKSDAACVVLGDGGRGLSLGRA